MKGDITCIVTEVLQRLLGAGCLYNPEVRFLQQCRCQSPKLAVVLDDQRNASAFSILSHSAGLPWSVRVWHAVRGVDVRPVREACQRRSTCKRFAIPQIRTALTPRSIRDFSVLVKVKS